MKTKDPRDSHGAALLHIADLNRQIAALTAALTQARREGFEEAIEEAVGIADDIANRPQSYNEVTARVIRDAIRALLPAQPSEVERLREEVEQLRVQLAGCGVAALCNTHESRRQTAKPEDYGWSQSYQDVVDAVGREIALREENERLQQYLAQVTRERDEARKALEGE